MQQQGKDRIAIALQKKLDSSKITNQREMQLKSLRRWCMGRISLHSLSGEHEDAQAISDEHMETLMGANEEHTLWMRIEKTA